MKSSISLQLSQIGMRIALSTFFFSIIWIGLASGTILFFDYNSSKEDILNKISEVGETQSSVISQSLWNFNSRSMETQLKSLSRLPWIAHIRIRATDGSLWQAGSKSEKNPVPVSFTLTYLYDGKPTQIGVLEITPDFELLRTGLKTMALKTLGIQTANAIFIAIAILILFHILAGRPLSEIASQASGITVENLDMPIKLKHKLKGTQKKDELDILESALNAMRVNLIQAFKNLQLSEERLDMALAASNTGIWDWDLRSNKVHWDDRFYTMLGYEPNEFQNSFDAWETRVHRDDVTRMKTAINSYLSGGIHSFIQEFRFLNKKGEFQWIMSKGKITVWDENKKPVRFIGTHQDITDLKQAEEKILNLQNYLANIINSMPSVLIGVNKDGLVTQWNESARKVAGISPESAKGRPLEEAYPVLADVLDSVKQSIEQGQVCFDSRRPRKNEAQVRYEDVTIYPLVSNGAEGAVIRIDDVTEQVRLEELMVQSEKMLSVGGLAAGMAHEINNPLAGMLQSAQVMQSRLRDLDMPANLRVAKEIGISMNDIGTFMEKRNISRMLDAIIDSGRRMREIIDNMLSFARKGDSNVSSHYPDQLLNQILELASTDYDLKKQYDFKSIKIIKKYEKDLPKIPCEKSKIQQVLLNILRNGAQAMLGQRNDEDVQPCFTLRLCVEKENHMLRMEVEDNGPGIDETIRPRIFEPFFTTKPEGVGTGLGLSVSYFIITQNHGGTMDVISIPGKGSTFVIRLPLEQNMMS